MRGIVVSDKMNKTVIVAVTRKFRHPLYKRVVKLTRKYFAHNEGLAKEGDYVQIEETRPLSKRKRWRVLPILEAAGAGPELVAEPARPVIASEGCSERRRRLSMIQR